MGTWYAVYNTNAGDLVSTTDEHPEAQPEGFSVVAVESDEQPDHTQWNPEGLNFDGPPAGDITRDETTEPYGTTAAEEGPVITTEVHDADGVSYGAVPKEEQAAKEESVAATTEGDAEPVEEPVSEYSSSHVADTYSEQKEAETATDWEDKAADAYADQLGIADSEPASTPAVDEHPWNSPSPTDETPPDSSVERPYGDSGTHQYGS